MNRDEYVRCRYCDSKLQPEKVTSLPKEKGCRHRKVAWKCFACGSQNTSFIFTEESEDV